MKIIHSDTSEHRELTNLTTNVNRLRQLTVNHGDILENMNKQLENISIENISIVNNKTVNESILPAHKTVVPNSDKLNVLCIMLDELIMLESLPKIFRDSLPGYNALKNMGINFTNFHTNRQMCSPSRCVYMSGKIDTGVVDNVEQSWQYSCKKNVYDLNSTGKLFATNAPNHITCFYGKSHLDAKLIPNSQVLPRFATNTVHAMKSYGFDKFNTNGDNLHFGHGYFSDQLAYNMCNSLDSVSHDIMEDGMKYEGAMPFLKARHIDKKHFHLQVNYHNPHDIMHFWSVPSQDPKPLGDMLTYGVPYYDEQKAEGIMSTTGTPNDSIYYFNDDDQDAYIRNPTLIKNWFKEFGDDTYEKYKTETSTLLFSETITDGYWSDNNKSLNPLMSGVNLLLKYNFTIPDKSMIVNWKNYQNVYLNMIQHADLYIKGMIDFLIESGLINNTSVVLYSDHGDNAGAFGLIEKGTPNKQSENIPLVIWSPLLDDTLKGTSTDKLVSTIDINPTLMNLANIDNAVIDNMDGVTIFTKNSNNKLILNPTDNLGTFCIINNWQVWTAVFFTLKYGDLPYLKTLNVPNDIWYNSPLPCKFANAHITFNTFVNGQKYKFTIWYNLHALFRFDVEKKNTIITNEMFNDVIQHLKHTYSTAKERNIIDTIVATYSLNIINKSFGDTIDLISTVIDNQFTALALIGIFFDLIINKFGKPESKFESKFESNSETEYNTAVNIKSLDGVLIDEAVPADVLGWEFSTNTDIKVTHLGFFDANNDGLIYDIPLRIYKKSSQRIITSGTITNSSISYNNAKYIKLDNSIYLNKNQTYIILAFRDKGETDGLYFSLTDENITFDNVITFKNNIAKPSTTFIYTDQKIPLPNYGFIGPTFIYEPINTGIVSMNTPSSGMTFTDYDNIINEGGFLYQELYNLDDDPNELHNLVDPNQNTSSEIETNKNIIKDSIWDNFQQIMTEKDCGELYNTLTFIRTYYTQIFTIIESNIKTFAEMTEDQFNDFVYPDKLKPINALFYDSMS